MVDGGFVLNGFWPFASGCEHSQWLFLGAVVEDAGGEAVDEGDLLVATEAVTIKDDWNVAGLRGTGSCSIVAQDVFVPKHRFLSLPAAIQGHAPGVELHDGTLFRSAAVPVLALAITPAALGAAELAFESFTSKLPGKEVAFTRRERQIEMPVTHLQVAEARTKIDTARLLLHHCADAIEAAAQQRRARWNSSNAPASAWIAPMPCASVSKRSKRCILRPAVRVLRSRIRPSAPGATCTRSTCMAR